MGAGVFVPVCPAAALIRPATVDDLSYDSAPSDAPQMHGQPGGATPHPTFRLPTYTLPYMLPQASAPHLS